MPRDENVRGIQLAVAHDLHGWDLRDFFTHEFEDRAAEVTGDAAVGPRVAKLFVEKGVVEPLTTRGETAQPLHLSPRAGYAAPRRSRSGRWAVLDEAREIADRSGLVFPSPTGRVLSDSTLSKLLRELRIGAVPHGFRSSFRDWAAERTEVPREVCELALAHVNSDRVEAAYRRSDLFERRRELMQAWASYVKANA